MWNENIDVPLMHVTWFKLQEMCHWMRIKYMFLVLALANSYAYNYVQIIYKYYCVSVSKLYTLLSSVICYHFPSDMVSSQKLCLC